MEATDQKTMIKASELRIGNYVLMENEEGNYWPMTIDDGIDIDNSDVFQPIPLTPEILEKCGFKNRAETEISGEDYISLRLTNGIDEYEICFFPSNTMKSISLFHKGALIGRTWEYLHQLQNLYFALTGEELQINL